MGTMDLTGKVQRLAVKAASVVLEQIVLAGADRLADVLTMQQVALR
jgi:hypothetical protein